MSSKGGNLNLAKNSRIFWKILTTKGRHNSTTQKGQVSTNSFIKSTLLILVVLIQGSHLLRGRLIALRLVRQYVLDDAVAHGLVAVRRNGPALGVPVGAAPGGADGVQERFRGAARAAAVQSSSTRRVGRAPAAAASRAADSVTRLPAVRQSKAWRTYGDGFAPGSVKMTTTSVALARTIKRILIDAWLRERELFRGSACSGFSMTSIFRVYSFTRNPPIDDLDTEVNCLSASAC